MERRTFLGWAASLVGISPLIKIPTAQKAPFPSIPSQGGKPLCNTFYSSQGVRGERIGYMRHQFDYAPILPGSVVIRAVNRNIDPTANSQSISFDSNGKIDGIFDDARYHSWCEVLDLDRCYVDYANNILILHLVPGDNRDECRSIHHLDVPRVVAAVMRSPDHTQKWLHSGNVTDLVKDSDLDPCLLVDYEYDISTDMLCSQPMQIVANGVDPELVPRW